MTEIIDLRSREVRDLVEAIRAVMNDGDFADETIRKVVRHLMNRARWTLFRRLTCFIATVCELKPELDPIRVLYVVAPHAASYQACFQTAAPDPETGARVALSKSGVTLRLDPDDTFRTLYAVMGRLCCAFHGVSEVLGPARALERVEEIYTAPRRKDALYALAADWMAEFDAVFRKTNEINQARRKMELALAHLLKARGGGGFSYRDVTSDDVLSFWLQNAAFEELNVRRYAKAHQAFVAFVERFAQETAAQAEWFGDSVNEEPDPESGVLPASHRISEADAPELGGSRAYEDWTELSDEVGEIKMLVGRAWARLTPFCDLPPEADNLMHSLLRVETFGPVENMLIQAKRDGRPTSPPPDPPADYAGMSEQVGDVVESFDAACWASVHVLYENERSNAIWAIAQLSDSEIDWIALAQERGVTLDPEARDPLEPLLAALRRQSAPPDGVAESLRDAERCWRSFERKGFLKSQLFEIDVVNQLDLLSMRMPGARTHVRERSGALARLVQSRASFDDDLRTFNAAFAGLYGNN